MTDSEVERLIQKLRESYPRHQISSREEGFYRRWFLKYEFPVVDRSIDCLVETSPDPVPATLRALIVERTPPRSDYQQQSRRERIAFEKEEIDRKAVLESVPPEEYDQRAKQVVEGNPWLRAYFTSRDFRSNDLVRKLVYHQIKSRCAH